MTGDLIVVLSLSGLVAVVGMPHGGLDSFFGRAALEPVVGRWWRPIFAGLYLATAAIVVTGWLVAPIFTVVVFFIVSAYHFGHADGSNGIIAVIEGGAVIWVPILARTQEVATILAWVVPEGQIEGVQKALSLAQPLLVSVAVVFAARVVWLVQSDKFTAARLLGFAALFALLPVLVSFGLFFCGWHSVREMVALARRADATNTGRGLRIVWWLAAPHAALAVLGTGLTAWWFAVDRELTPVVVQALFLGLSAVAVPHILLHVTLERLGVDPFVGKGSAQWPLTATI